MHALIVRQNHPQPTSHTHTHPTKQPFVLEQLSWKYICSKHTHTPRHNALYAIAVPAVRSHRKKNSLENVFSGVSISSLPVAAQEQRHPQDVPGGRSDVCRLVHIHHAVGETANSNANGAQRSFCAQICQMYASV